VSTEDLENFEADRELQLAQEYQDVAAMFKYAVETERRFYLANMVDVQVLADGPRPMVEIRLTDAWVWDMYRKSRFVPSVRVVTFKDVNVEELPREEVEPPI
jgi:Protein of unknown function (DUF2469)